MSSSISPLRELLTRRQFACGLPAWLACARDPHAQAWRRPISFGVFSLFEPQELNLKSDTPLLLKIDESRYLVSPDSPAVLIRREGNSLDITIGSLSQKASRLGAMSNAGGAANLMLEVPPSSRHGSIRRRFHGTFEIQAAGEQLQPIVAMDIERAVASIVGAECPQEGPPAFLMAQAIASRSFVVAAQAAHVGFDFCDTTHCQYLRGAAPAESPAGVAAARTAGLCLSFNGLPLAAMYSRSCSGRTSSLSELGLPSRGYPYYPVECEFCSRSPETWQRVLDWRDAPRSERERIALDRVYGWSMIPSGSFSEAQGLLEGRGFGHGLGLCQRGAEAMAKAGSRYPEILAHYYANTGIALT